MRGTTAITIKPLNTFKLKNRQEQIKKAYGQTLTPQILMSSGNRNGGKRAAARCRALSVGRA